MLFADADEGYRAAIEASGHQLGPALGAARAIVETSDRDQLISGRDITNAILLRLGSFQRNQELIKGVLGKRFAAPAADFFVETACFFLKAVLETMIRDLFVASERPIVRRRGAMRPDISIWRGNEVVAVVECKTQLGWNRDDWRMHFDTRQQKLTSEFPNALLFFLVMTKSNWGGFGDDPLAGKRLFVLLDGIWPSKFEVARAPEFTVHRVEALLEQILIHVDGDE